MLGYSYLKSLENLYVDTICNIVELADDSVVIMRVI